MVYLLYHMITLQVSLTINRMYPEMFGHFLRTRSFCSTVICKSTVIGKTSLENLLHTMSTIINSQILVYMLKNETVTIN